MTKLYLIRADGIDAVKVGYATDLEKRLMSLQIGCPRKLSVVAVSDGGAGLEAELHKTLKDAHIRGEWFDTKHKLVDELMRFMAEGKSAARWLAHRALWDRCLHPTQKAYIALRTL